MSKKINKIGLITPEDLMYDNSYTKDLLEWLSSNKDKDIKTILIENESL